MLFAGGESSINVQSARAQSKVTQGQIHGFVKNATPEKSQITPSGGSSVYSRNCLICHGGLGNGRGPLATNQPDKPRDFTDKAWMINHADGTLFLSILRGVPGTSMPAFAGRLSERDLWSVVAYIRGFWPYSPLTRPPNDGQAASRTNVNDGILLYFQKCSGCHGDNGRGNGKAAAFFDRSPRDLTNRDWMASRSDEALRGVVRYGVPGSPMPGFVDEMREDQLTSLVAHLRRLSGTLPGNNSVGGIGAALYTRHCAACHGVEGDANAPGANQFSPRPRDFRNPLWMSGQTSHELATAITYGRPGTNMPPFRALLTPDDTTALVKYIRGFAQSIPGAGASKMVYPEELPGVEADVYPSKRSFGEKRGKP